MNPLPLAIAIAASVAAVYGPAAYLIFGRAS